MIADPPYGVSYEPSWRGRRKLGGGKLAVGKVLNDDRIDWRQAYTSLSSPDHQKSYLGSRGNGMNPSRFGIFTLGSDCASSTSSVPTTPLRLRM
jgi:hypothetical protein